MSEPARRVRNLGILAHVDAGKTSLTEAMLYRAGSIREAGSVDKGTSHSDAMAVERRRGISVRASALAFEWQDVRLQLIDTPGHVDFAAEVERALRVLDAAVLVVSAVEGIQAHTETLWRACAQMGLPVAVFVNKIDRVGADAAAVVEALRAELGAEPVWLNRSHREGTPGATAVPLDPAAAEAVTEAVAAQDDALLADYLEGTALEPARVRASLAAGVAARRLVSVVCGAAKTGAGVEDLLAVLTDLMPEAPADSEAPASAAVFRLDHDPKLGRVAGVRVFAGRFEVRDRVDNATAGRQERITQIRRLEVDRLADAQALAAGDIGFLCGMPEVRIGDVLGDPTPVPGGVRLSEPLLSVQVLPDDEAGDLTPLSQALGQLASEDPHLDVRLYPEERELHVRIMGAVQTEILGEVLRDRFDLGAGFSAPAVVYRETPAGPGLGEEAYTMPKPCWAIVGFRVEAAPRGTGIRYRSEVDVSDIAVKYQREIEQTLDTALAQGPKGWQVTDLDITLVSGSHHLLHSRPGDFKLATNMALLKGLTDAGTTLLEPFLAFRASGPEAAVGKLTADIAHMRGTFEPPEVGDGAFRLQGRVPLATSMDYAIRFGSLTGGRGTWAVRPDGYEPCPDELGQVRAYKGISPLDRAKYILWWRGAITDAVT